MKGANALYHYKAIDFFFEFVPQIILMSCLFGYMDMLIIIKWLTPWVGNEAAAPPIIATMIGMFLKFGAIPEGTQALVESPDYQQWLSTTLLLVGLLCVPTMLVIKPLHWYYTEGQHHVEHKDGHHALLDGEEVELSNIENKQIGDKLDDEEDHKAIDEDNPDVPPGKIDSQAKLKQSLNESQQMDDLVKFAGQSSDERHDFSEVFIHQLIETIEFVLGTVSNTASYLRLWALSLAHSQLAAVFYEKLLGAIALEANEGKGSGILLFLLFPAFFSMTFFVLMCMDAMECFLH